MGSVGPVDMDGVGLNSGLGVNVPGTLADLLVGIVFVEVILLDVFEIV
jgi:hypothetical protein